MFEPILEAERETGKQSYNRFRSWHEEGRRAPYALYLLLLLTSEGLRD